MRRGAALAAAVVLVLAAATVAQAVDPKPRAKAYEGVTSQFTPVRVKVNAPHRVHRFFIRYYAECGGGNSYSGTIADTDTQNDKIKQQDGAFSGAATKSEDAGSGYRGKVHLTYHGKFTKPTEANGKATVIVTVTKDGETAGTCPAKGIVWRVDADG